MELGHKTETLDYFGVPVEVDRKIVPFMKALWALGLLTLNSCENLDGDVFVMFASIQDARQFLKTALKEDLLGMLAHHAMLAQRDGKDGQYSMPQKPLPRKDWYANLHPATASQKATTSNLMWGVAILFPCHDLPYVMQQLASQGL